MATVGDSLTGSEEREKMLLGSKHTTRVVRTIRCGLDIHSVQYVGNNNNITYSRIHIYYVVLLEY